MRPSTGAAAEPTSPVFDWPPIGRNPDNVTPTSRRTAAFEDRMLAAPRREGSSWLARALGTHWGRVRQYWVVFKLSDHGVATAVLLTYMQTFRAMADTAADPGTDLDAVRSASPLIHGPVALLLLLVATVLAVYKPKGLTAYGRRKLRARRAGSPPNRPA